MGSKLSDEVLKNCKALWLSGCTLGEVARHHGVSHIGLAEAIAEFSGVGVKEMKEERLRNIADERMEEFLEMARLKGGLPSKSLLFKECFGNAYMRDYVLLKLKEAGFERVKTVYKRKVVTPERMERAAELFMQGKNRKTVAEAMGITVNQVHFILDEYSKKTGRNLNSLRAEKNKQYWMAEGWRVAEELNRMPFLREIPGFPTYYFDELRAGLMAKGFVRGKQVNLPNTKYSREFLLKTLKDLAAELGHTPSSKELLKWRGIAGPVFASRFGSIRRAHEEAGLAPNKRGAQFGNKPKHRQKYKPEELIEAVREVAKELGKTPGIKEMIKRKRLYPHQFKKYFGGYRNAVIQAGLVPNEHDFGGGRDVKYGPEELISILQEVAKELDKTPNILYLENHRKIYFKHFKRHFGSYKNALVKAGLEPYDRADTLGLRRRGYSKYTPEDLISLLQEVAKELGRTPSAKYLEKHKKPGFPHFKRHFGSYKNALEKAGLEPAKIGPQLGSKHSVRGKLKYKPEDLISALQEVARELGKTPAVKYMEKHKKINHHHFRTHFGSYINAVVKAGLEPNMRFGLTERLAGGYIKYKPEDLISALQEVANELGKTPRMVDIRERKKLDRAHFRTHFGSYKNALVKAGLVKVD